MHTLSHPVPLGTSYEAGFYAGLILVGQAPLIIVAAPKAEGEILTPIFSRGAGVDVPGALSVNDSMANTIALAEAGAEMANWARGLQIGGKTDWCVPARDVLEVLYRNFKPSTDLNYCTYRDGDNPSSLPPGHLYTEASPAQTELQAFQAGGAEAFELGWYASSTQSSPGRAYLQFFSNGSQDTFGVQFKARARAVRLIPFNA